MEREPPQSDSFVLRIWRQSGEAGWRGWVQHTRSGESGVVRDMEELAAFIERQLSRTVGQGRRGLQ